MSIRKLSRLAAGALALMSIAMVGCGPKVTRTADVSSGDYYSAEEFKNLSKEQRDAYCADMDAQLATLEAGAGTASSQGGQVRADVTKVQGELKSLQTRYDTAKAQTDGIGEEIDWYEGLPKTHTVEKGEFLQKISGYETIYNDPLKWPRIWRANKGMLQEQGPNLIYPGWELQIPRDWPTSWTVKDGEYLGKIAGYWEVYGDPTHWTKLYEANRDQIKDPDMIWPSWQLTVPRDGE